MYKIIFSDLDATLLNDKKQISDTDKYYIKKLIENNYYFILCSGRSNMSLKNFEIELGLDKINSYTVAYSGSLIYNTNTNEIISNHYISKDKSLEIFDFCSNYNCDILAYAENKLFITNNSYEVDTYAKISMLEPVYVNNIKEISSKKINKIIALGYNKVLKEIEKDFNQKYNFDFVNCFFSSKKLLEFNPPHTDKGIALNELCSHLNIDIKDSIAIGDNYNDISMLQKSGLGIAVNNSDEAIKEKADVILKEDNNNSAVGYAINKYFNLK